jgi:hypothetical protein
MFNIIPGAASPKDSVVARLIDIMQRCDLSYCEVAAASACSSTTLRACLLTGMLPSRHDARTKLTTFVNANAGAAGRSQVRFTP